MVTWSECYSVCGIQWRRFLLWLLVEQVRILVSRIQREIPKEIRRLLMGKVVVTQLSPNRWTGKVFKDVVAQEAKNRK